METLRELNKKWFHSNFFKKRSRKFGYFTDHMKHHFHMRESANWILIQLCCLLGIGLGCNGNFHLGSPLRNRFVIKSVGIELVQVVGTDTAHQCAIIQPAKDTILNGRLGIGIKLQIAYLSDSSDGTYGKIGYFAPGQDGLKDSITAFRLGIKSVEGAVRYLKNDDFVAPDFDCVDYEARPTMLLNGVRHPYRVCCPLPIFSGVNDLVGSLNQGGSLPLTSDHPNQEDLIELFIWGRDSLLPNGTQVPPFSFEVLLSSGKVLRANP
jgi:hypothetical protein